MSTVQSTGSGTATGDRILRRRFLVLAGVNFVLLNLHLLDHVLRGERIHANGLNSDWDHSGWPFRPELTPFTIAAVVLNGLLVVGIALTLRRRAWAGYWLATAILLGGTALWIHFLYGQKSESPSVIMRSYGDELALGIPALMILFGLLAAIVATAWQATHARRVSGRW